MISYRVYIYARSSEPCHIYSADLRAFCCREFLCLDILTIHHCIRFDFYHTLHNFGRDPTDFCLLEIYLSQIMIFIYDLRRCYKSRRNRPVILGQYIVYFTPDTLLCQYIWCKLFGRWWKGGALTDFIENDIIISLPYSYPLKRWEAVIAVDIFTFTISFLISVGAGVVGNYLYDSICKWLDGNKK